VDKRTIGPLGSPEEIGTLNKAFADLTAVEFRGAKAHLAKAAEALTLGQWADSVRESIHAVESVTRVLEPDADLSKALGRLAGSTGIHGSLKSGMIKLYGYSSDEQGIRHSLLEKGDASVDETDALFMLGACAAFVSYIINKARKAGLITS
jgi:hypothetical protein